MNKVLVLLADGFEECEALLVVDILRRAKMEVETVSISDSLTVTSSHKVSVQADTTIDKADFDGAEMMVLPGGMPGTNNLAANPVVVEQCRRFAAGKRLAAVCAAPSVLGGLGLLEGKKAIVYPGFEDKLIGAKISRKNVVTDGNITTGQALGASIPFALEIVRVLEGEEASRNVAKQICYKQ